MKKLFSTLIILLSVYAINAQVATIVDYSFNTASALPVAPDAIAANLTSSVTMTEAFTTKAGTATSGTAFTANATAGNALELSPDASADYYTLSLGGNGLLNYTAFKMYFQAQRSAAGATGLTVTYSVNGGAYQSFAGNTMAVTASYTAVTFDLSTITAINNPQSLTFKITCSGGTGGNVEIDNLEMQANYTLITPTQFTVTNISPASPQAGICFSALVTAVNASGVAGNVASNTSFLLTTNNGGGISGTTSGTITSGNSSVTVSGIVLGATGSSTLTATAFGLTGTSAAFTVQTASAASMTANPSSAINYGTVLVGNSAVQSFQINTTNVVGNVTVQTTGAPFLVSSSPSGPFSSSIALTPNCGSLSQNVYVQYLPTGTGAASGTVTLSATGVSNVNISLSGTGQTPATTFSTGNLVVLSVGNGSTAIANTATPISLVELTTSGFETGDSVSIPSTGATVLTQNGTTGPEGELSLSPDGLYLTYGGYDVTFGTSGNVTSGTGQRAVGYTTNNNTTNIIAGPAGFLSAQNCRGAVTDGCGNFWAPSAGSANGIVYFGSNHANGSVSNSPITTARALGLFNNQLYFSTQSGTYGIYTVDSSTYGAPTTPGAVQTSLIASPSGSAANSTALPFGFFFNPTGTICYIADNRTTADSTTGLQVQSGGIERFNLVGSTWTYQYTLPVSANAGVGAAWLTADFSGSNPIIYATTTEAASNRIVKITDAGATSNYATIATSAFNNIFRGVAFSPSAIATPAQASGLNFTNVLTNSMSTNWANNGGTGNLVYINTTNSFTAPSGTAATSGNPAYSGSGQQLVYSGTGNTVNITGLNPATTYYFEVYSYNQVNCSYQYNTTTASNNPNSQITATPVVPLVSVNPGTLNFGSVVVGNTYELQYTVSASNVDPAQTLNITAPANFGLSLTTGGPYTSTLSLPQTSGGVAGTIIYVGFSPTSATLYTGTSISNADNGATTQFVTVSGTGVNPAISVSGTLAFGNINLTNTSLPQSFNVSGTNLISDVTVTAPAGYQVSLAPCGTYGSTVAVPVAGIGTPQGGTLASTPVYVEFTPTANGSANTNLVASASQATSQNQAVTGSGVTVTGFGTGNLAILTVGTGCSPLTSSATAGSLIEFTLAGVQTGYDFAIPSTGGSKLTFSGSASYDAPLGLSTDSLLLVFGGYNASAGTSSVTSGTNPRGVSSLTQNGTYGIVTSATLFSAGNCRQAASDGCNNYWVTGNASGGGVAYFGNVSPAADVQTTVTNDRGIQLNNGNIYFSTTTTTPGVYSLGAAPLTAMAPTLVINTSTGSSGTGSSPAGFVFNKAFTICYIADDRNTADSTSGLTVESGGIQKWTLVGSTWTYQYTLPVSANGVAGARWLTVDFGGTNPVIYATTAEGTNNRLVSITDNGNPTNGAYNTLSTAGSNYIYRGIAFTPKSVAAPTVQDNSIHFTAITAGNMTVTWTNGNGSGHLVRIDTANLFTHPKFDSTYAGEISTVYTGNGQQAVYSGTGNSVTITGLTAGKTYWIRVYGYNTDNCTVQYDTTTAVDNPIPNINTWTGVTSAIWTIGTNWSSGAAPGNSCSSNVLIPSGTPFSPTLSTAQSIGNVTLLDGATLTLNANLGVCGDWIGGTSSNGIVAGTGVLALNSTVAQQTISGHTHFQELLLNNTSGAKMLSNSSVDVYTTLDLQAGAFDATTGTLTFLSTSVTQAAILNNFSAGYTGTITGNITAQRYFNSATTYTQQHEMGSPINNTTMAQFGSTSTSGGYVTPDHCDEQHLNYTSVYGNVFSTHENAPGAAGCAMAEWYVEPETDAAVNGVGYSVLKAGPGTFSITGAPNVTSNYTLNGLTNSNWSNTTLQGHTLKSGWHLMGNPYLAPLNLTTVNAGFDNQVLVWNAEGPYAGSFVSYTVGSNAVLAPFQAFMVHMTAPGNNGSYTINGSDRVIASPTFYMQNDNQLDIIAANLSTGLLDKTTVAFNSHATDNFDPQYDANKSAGSLNRHTLYTTIADGDWMAINVLNSVATTGSVPMGFEPGANGNYSFNFGNLNTFDPTTYIYLEDLQQHTMYNVRNGDYLFSADSADNWNRFVLHFTPAAVIAATDADCNRAGAINIIQPGAANWNFTLVNSNNVAIASGVLNQANPLNLSATKGNYTLTLVDNNNYTVTKQIQVNGAEAITAAFVASNATVNTQTMVSFINNSVDANTYNWNFGDGSTSNLVSPEHAYAAPGTYLVELNAQNITGCTSITNQSIKVINSTTATTPVSDNGITMWSSTNRIYIDFSQLSKVDASIKVYDVLGQELVNGEFTASALYQKEIDNTTAACVIVSVKNGGEITTKKLFLISTK